MIDALKSNGGSSCRMVLLYENVCIGTSLFILEKYLFLFFNYLEEYTVAGLKPS